MTKEDYMRLPKERLAELLAERDAQHRINCVPTSQFVVPCYAPGGICTNPQRDCINCPKPFGDGTTTITAATLEDFKKAMKSTKDKSKSKWKVGESLYTYPNYADTIEILGPVVKVVFDEKLDEWIYTFKDPAGHLFVRRESELISEYANIVKQ